MEVILIFMVNNFTKVINHFTHKSDIFEKELLRNLV